MIEVWEPGQGSHSHTSVVVPFTERVPSETEALAVAFQTAKKWIVREASR
jgi:hypothetical protein